MDTGQLSQRSSLPSLGLDLRKLDELVWFYFQAALAPSTQRTYRSGKNRYQKFCEKAAVTPIPVTEQTLCRFVAYLAQEGLAHQTIKGYLSVVRHLQISRGLPDPFQQAQPKLVYTLKGIKSTQAKESHRQSRSRLPMTPKILCHMRQILNRAQTDRNNIMIWAACCMCFYGFLCSGEITVPSRTGYDPGAHLSQGDVAIDDPGKMTMVQIKIKASKTDPFHHGIMVYVEKTGNELCLVAAITAYLAIRGTTTGTFFLFEDSTPLTRPRFVEQVRLILCRACYSPGLYESHSFRIGTATTAAACGAEDSTIQTLGRWERAAYLRYVRIPREKLASISKPLSNVR